MNITMVNEWVKENFWNLLVTLVAISMGWAVLSARITAVEVKAEESKVEIEKYSQLVERVVKLEENRLNVQSDIAEIKEDLKDLKKHFNVR